MRAVLARLLAATAVTAAAGACALVAGLDEHSAVPDGIDSGDAGSGDGAADAAADAAADVTLPVVSCTDIAVVIGPDLLDEAHGVFVAADAGLDGGRDGGRGTPFATIAEALAARTSGKNIYLCEGTYAESLDLVDTVDDPYAVYGGLRCVTWTQDVAAHVEIRPDAGPVLRVAHGVGTVRVQDVALYAPNGKTPGEPSIAVIVERGDVLLVRVAAHAGAGADAPPTDAPPSNEFAASLDGDPAGVNTIGLDRNCTCPATKEGTHGGYGGTYVDLAERGAPLLGGGAAGGLNGCLAGGTGGTGGNGAPGAPGVGGSFGRAGSLVDGGATTWITAPGSDGRSGSVAQGGGGGRGNNGVTLRGGGGACGGCGGAGGLGGGGGGASISVLLVTGALKMCGSTLRAASGGAGGRGGDAGAAQAGGGGGYGTAGGCYGGAGGRGGEGAPGGGGAGGITAALAYAKSVSKPSVDDTTTLAAGDGGAGGASSNLDGGAGALGRSATFIPF